MRKEAINGAIDEAAWASMGPQHESCGKKLTRQKIPKIEKASMGPQHESCGK